MSGPKARRQQCIQRLADDVGCFAIKHVLGGLIEEKDPVLFIHRNDPVHGRGNDVGQTLALVGGIRLG